MWHEARKQERVTKKIFTDLKKRARIRYEESKDQVIDPRLSLKLKGYEMRITVDTDSHNQANRLVSCQGVFVDRFDVRMFMQDDDFKVAHATTASASSSSSLFVKNKSNEEAAKPKTVLDFEEKSATKRALNFERYRLLMQNDFAGIDEEKKLQLILKNSELFGLKNRLPGNHNQHRNNSSSSLAPSTTPHVRSTMRPGVAIPFNYDPLSLSTTFVDSQSTSNKVSEKSPSPNIESELIDDSDFNFDLDDSLKLKNFSEFELKRLNEISKRYGLVEGDFELLTRLSCNPNFTSNEIVKELEKLTRSRERALEKQRIKAQQSLNYGPSLPVSIRNKSPKTSQSSSPSSSTSSLLVGQRSPSAKFLPMPVRCDEDNNYADVESASGSCSESDNNKNLTDKEQEFQAILPKISPNNEVDTNTVSNAVAQTVMQQRALLKQIPNSIKQSQVSPFDPKLNSSLSRRSMPTTSRASPPPSSSSSSSATNRSQSDSATDYTSSSSSRSSSVSSSSSSSSDSSESKSDSSRTTASRSSKKGRRSRSQSSRSDKSKSEVRSRGQSRSRSRTRSRFDDYMDSHSSANWTSRRASTPLAYKRNRRSSRSLSREMKRRDRDDHQLYDSVHSRKHHKSSQSSRRTEI